MRVLEPETTGQFERGMKTHGPTAHRRAKKMSGNGQQKRLRFQEREPFSR